MSQAGGPAGAMIADADWAKRLNRKPAELNSERMAGSAWKYGIWAIMSGSTARLLARSKVSTITVTRSSHDHPPRSRGETARSSAWGATALGRLKWKAIRVVCSAVG